jgi:hypothetical protein
VIAALGLFAALPASAWAQAEADSDVSVQNAIVTLEGYGSTLTNTEGRFRFRGVAAGDYTLRVDAFGYATLSRSVSVAAEMDVTMELPLEPSPVPLDAIVVEAGTLDFNGRVRDPVRDFIVVDAQVLVRGRDPVWTDTHGRFDVDDPPEGVPVRMTVRAFGYLPIDTAFIPDDDERYVFDLAHDPFAEAHDRHAGRQTRPARRGSRLGGEWRPRSAGRAQVYRRAHGRHYAGVPIPRADPKAHRMHVYRRASDGR